MIIIIIFGNILPRATILFNIMQTKLFNVAYLNKKILDFIYHLKIMRNDFDSTWEKSEHYLISETPSRFKRQKVTYVYVDKKTKYRRLYLEIIDTLIVKMNERFSDINQLNFFSLLDFSKFNQYVKQFPI